MSSDYDTALYSLYSLNSDVSEGEKNVSCENFRKLIVKFPANHNLLVELS